MDAEPGLIESLRKAVSALPDDRRQAFNDVWDEVKAFYAK